MEDTQAVPELTAAPTGQEPAPQVTEPGDVERLQGELERLRAELTRVREEASRRRIEKKSLEERLTELEAAMATMRERALRAELRAQLVAELGDPAVADAAQILAREAGLVVETDEGPRVNLEGLLQRFPFLRRQQAVADKGAAPPSAPTPGWEDIAAMSSDEYAARRQEILARLQRRR